MQSRFSAGEGGADWGRAPARQFDDICGGQTLGGLRHHEGGGGQCGFCGRAGIGSALGGQSGGGVGLLAAVESLPQCEAIVASGDSLLGTGEGIDGRLQLGRGKVLGTGGAGGINGSLRLMHFLLRRFSAG